MKTFLTLLFLCPVLVYAETGSVPEDAAAKAPPTLHTQRRALFKETQAQLLQGDFAALTKAAQQYRTNKEKFTDGNWKLDCFYGAFETLKPDEWPAMMQKLEEWNTQETKDPAPVIAIAHAYFRWGMQARGGGYANTVTDEGWKLMNERLKTALSKLMPAAQRCRSCPGFYDILMAIGQTAGMDRGTFEGMFQAGIRLEPTYWRLYELKAYYLLPRWYGKPGEEAQYVQDTLKSNPQAALWILYRMQYQGVDKNLFQQEGIAWESVKADLKKGVAADLKGVAQANMLAYLADVAGDQETVADALRPVDFMIDPSMWKSKTRWQEIQAAHKSGTLK